VAGDQFEGFWGFGLRGHIQINHLN
jgi:hypothetical protein